MTDPHAALRDDLERADDVARLLAERDALAVIVFRWPDNVGISGGGCDLNIDAAMAAQREGK